VTAVACGWHDSRPARPERPEQGRTYYLVETEPEGLYLLCFEPGKQRRERGRWVVYRGIEMVPVKQRDMRKAAE
jgi:hypothetical protein